MSSVLYTSLFKFVVLMMTGEWRKLHNEELNNLYSSPYIVWAIKSRRMIGVGREARMGERRDLYRVLVGEPVGKKPLGRPRRRWKYIGKMGLQEVGLGGRAWTVLLWLGIRTVGGHL
jgi:hypothetical protein